MPAPVEAKVLDAMKRVQKLTGPELDKRISDEVGDPMLGSFKALAAARVGRENRELINQTVHLMVLAYLMNNEARR